MTYSRPSPKISFTLYDFLAVVILVVVATLLQDAWPPFAFGQAKPQFLTALVIYYAWTRPFAIAFPVTLVCGIVQNGLGSLPNGASVVLMLGVMLFCTRFAKDQLPDRRASCVILAIALAPLLTGAEYYLMRISGRIPEMRYMFIGSRVLWSIILAAPVSLATVLVAQLLNSFAAQGRKEGAYGYGSSATSVRR